MVPGDLALHSGIKSKAVRLTVEAVALPSNLPPIYYVKQGGTLTPLVGDKNQISRFQKTPPKACSTHCTVIRGAGSLQKTCLIPPCLPREISSLELPRVLFALVSSETQKNLLNYYCISHFLVHSRMCLKCFVCLCQANLVAAFEQSLVNMTSRLRHLAETAEEKVRGQGGEFETSQLVLPLLHVTLFSACLSVHPMPVTPSSLASSVKSSRTPCLVR